MGGGIFLGPLGPFLAMISALAVRETISFVGTNREKLFLHSAFSRYLSPQVMKNPGASSWVSSFCKVWIICGVHARFAYC
jgi:hypothetical protein